MTSRRILLLVCSSLTTLALATRLAAPAGEPSAPPPPKTILPMPIRLIDPPIRDTLRWRCKPGYAMLRCRINQKGVVVETKLIERFPVSLCVDSSDATRIDDLAQAVTRGWAFTPATTGGVAQSILVDVPVYVPPDTLHVPRHDGVLVGTVRHALTGAPVPGVRIELVGSALVTHSDRHGIFKIDHLVRLRGPVSAELIRFMPDTVLADVVPGRIDTLRVRLRPFAGTSADSSGSAR